jgi:hypothetical protein
MNRKRIWIARAVAVGADVLQIGLFPFFLEGFASILDDVLDVIVCVVLSLLVGWHYSFLPSFILKLVPFADIVPTWSIAVLLATRKKAGTTVTDIKAGPPNTPPLLEKAGIVKPEQE